MKAHAFLQKSSFAKRMHLQQQKNKKNKNTQLESCLSQKIKSPPHPPPDLGLGLDWSWDIAMNYKCICSLLGHREQGNMLCLSRFRFVRHYWLLRGIDRLDSCFPTRKKNQLIKKKKRLEKKTIVWNKRRKAGFLERDGAHRSIVY